AAAQTSSLSSNYSYLNSQSNYFNSGSPVDWGNLTADLFTHGVNQPSLLLLQARLVALALPLRMAVASKFKKIKIAAVVVLALIAKGG
ncbi:MAG: hypothetical protein IJ520_10405, partial [Synergistaceae bacterium]|nr:hypothetical protein [Synergistaceae bacterium]